jgi:hypothetical protein
VSPFFWGCGNMGEYDRTERAVASHFALVSSVIHMLSPWHKNDYPPAPNEDKLRDAVRPLNIPPGDYCGRRSSPRR